jgi:hypothetical protein
MPSARPVNLNHDVQRPPRRRPGGRPGPPAAVPALPGPGSDHESLGVQVTVLASDSPGLGVPRGPRAWRPRPGPASGPPPRPPWHPVPYAVLRLRLACQAVVAARYPPSRPVPKPARAGGLPDGHRRSRRTAPPPGGAVSLSDARLGSLSGFQAEFEQNRTASGAAAAGRRACQW